MKRNRDHRGESRCQDSTPQREHHGARTIRNECQFGAKAHSPVFDQRRYNVLPHVRQGEIDRLPGVESAAEILLHREVIAA